MKYLLSFLEKHAPAFVWDTDKTDGTPASKSAVSPVEVPTKPTEPGSVGFVGAPAGEAAGIEGSGAMLVLEVASDDRHRGRSTPAMELPGLPAGDDLPAVCGDGPGRLVRVACLPAPPGDGAGPPRPAGR